MPKVSVIVPIYNVEKYIERCVRSLFEQTLDDIEYIFVNDCTPDNSIQILKNVLEEYPQRKAQVKILNHVQNQGQAGARTTGMKAMTGEYMIHCDPDDWVELDMYEKMYNKAIENGCDIVACNWIIETGHTSIKQYIKYSSIPLKSLINCQFDPYLWHKLIKSQLIHDYSIYPYKYINCGEDLNVSIRVLYYAKNIIVINFHPYHYVQNNNSITHQNHKYLFETSHKPNIEKICEFLSNNPIDSTLLQNYIKFQGKFGLILCNEFKVWSKTWPECHKYIKYFPMSKRYRTIISLFANYPLLLSLYYKYLNWRTRIK